MTVLPLDPGDDTGLDTVRAPSRRGYATSVRADMPGKSGYTVRINVQDNLWRGYTCPALPLGKLRGRTVVDGRVSFKTVNGWPNNTTLTVRRPTSDWDPATLAWNNQPSIGSTIVTRTLPALGPDERRGIDIRTLLQEVADGAPWYGLRFTTDYAAGPLAMWGYDSGHASFIIEFLTSDNPEIPTRLVPSGGAWVGIKKPTLSAQYADADGNSTMRALRVQISPNGNANNVTWDSGWRTARRPRLDTADTNWAGLQNQNDTTAWRINVRDSDGNESGYSPWAFFGYRPVAPLTPLSPATGVPTIYDTTPILAAAFGGTAELKAQRVFITRPNDRSDVVWDSKERPPFSTSEVRQAIPLRNRDGDRVLEDGRSYQACFRAWPDVDRDAVPGSPDYAQLWISFNVDDDLAATAPVLNSVTQAGGPLSARQRLSWTYPAVPDGGWAICCNGTVVERLGPMEPNIPASGQYAYTVKRLGRPNTDNTWSVKAVVNGKQSKPSNTITKRLNISHVWLLPYEDDGSTGPGVKLRGVGVDDWGRNDRRAIYSLLSGREVDVLDGQGLNGGTFEGTLWDEKINGGITKAAAESRLAAMNSKIMEPVWLLGGDFLALVLLRSLSWQTPDPRTSPGNMINKVRFGWKQVNPARYETGTS